MNFVLDSSAVIAFFNDESGADNIEKLLNRASKSECTLLMHNASVAEFYYDFLRRGTKQDAALGSEILTAYPITFIDTISTDLIKQIGHFKSRYKISFADAFVLATAKLNNAKVLTSDHHEFDDVEKNGDIAFEWIR